MREWAKRLSRVFGGDELAGLYGRDLPNESVRHRGIWRELLVWTDLLKIYKDQLKGVFGPDCWRNHEH